MRIGLQIPYFNWEGGAPIIAPTLKKIVTEADAAGFDSIWVMDHFFQMEMAGGPDDPMLEAYTTLGFIAALTEHAKLGVLVTGVIYRYPGLLAKTITTLDVLSGGRAYLGIGAAWYEREALGLGVPFPSTSERFEQLEEALQIMRQMWSDNNGSFNGKHYQLAETINHPQPMSQPYPRIMIGGTGEKKTLRLVAQYADACNFFSGMGIDGLKHKLDVLRDHCDHLGRDYNSIEKTVIHHIPSLEEIDALPNICREWADLGIDHAIFNMQGLDAITPIHDLRDKVIPVVKDY